MKNQIKNQFAVVTGASMGLGRAFAIELAERGCNVILVSLPGQSLKELSNLISSKYNVQTHYFETDLSDDRNIKMLTDHLNNNFNISILINNAGVGGSMSFELASTDYLNKIIQVNVKATIFLTHQLLSNLKRQPKSYILNVSSIAAFSPVGYKTVYPASKAFVHSFSRGLYQELKDSNVFVSVVNPGAMATNDEIISRIKKQGIIGKLTLLEPKKVAHYCINRLLKRDTVIMVNPITWLIGALTPIWLKLPLMTQIVKREISYEKGFCDRC
jgi:hypothetical protein